jgi:tetratricopeptide (TPR) repeat protein
MGRPEALQDFDQAIALQPNAADAYYNRAQVYAAQRQVERAMADLNQAIQLNPQLAEAYGNRGLLYMNQGDRAKALTDLRQAAALFQQQGDRDANQQTQRYIEQIQLK